MVTIGHVLLVTATVCAFAWLAAAAPAADKITSLPGYESVCADVTCTMSTLTVVSCTASLSTSTSTQGTSLLTKRLAATCSTGLWRAKAVPLTTRWCCVRHHTTALVLCPSSPTPHHVHGFVACAGMNGGPGCSSILGVCVSRVVACLMPVCTLPSHLILLWHRLAH